MALCAVLAAWHGPFKPDRAGFDLPAGPASSNVDNKGTGADEAVPPAALPELLDTLPQATEERPAAAPAGGHQSSKPPLIDLPPLPPAPPPREAPPSHSHRDLQPGERIMAYLKTLRLPLALAAAFAAQPLAAADVEKQPTLEQTAKDVKDLKDAQKKSTDALMEQLKKIETQLQGVESVRKDLGTLKSTVESLNTTLELSRQNAKSRAAELAETQGLVKQLRADLEQARAQAGKLQQQLMDQTARCDGLTDQIAQLNRKVADGSRQAARIAEATGTIRLFNTYPMPVDIRVNDRVYHLDPNGSYVLASQPVGSFTYEVLGLSPPATRTLRPDRPYDLEVYDLARGPVKTPPPIQR